MPSISGNDANKLSTEIVKQLNGVLQKVHTGGKKYMAEVKSQNNKTSTVQVYSENRETTKTKVKEHLKKRGMNLATGTGYAVTNKMFAGSRFGGLQFMVQHDGDNFKHNVVLRFKPLSVGKKTKKLGKWIMDD